MAFNWTGALAGGLGEFGRQAEEGERRRIAIEQARMEREIDERRELAKLAKEEALMKYNYYREDQRDKRNEDNIASREKIAGERVDASERAAERRHQESMARASGSGGGDKSERKGEAILNDPNLTEEEKKAAYLKWRGVPGKDDNGLSEVQEMRVYDKLAKYDQEGITDENLPDVQRLRKLVKLPPLQKKLVKAGEDKWFGKDTKDEYEYVEGEEATVAEESGNKPAAALELSDETEKNVTGEEQVQEGQPRKAMSLADARAMLVDEPKKENSVTKKIGSVLEDASEVKTDIGSVMGQAIKGVVNSGKLAAKSAAELKALDEEVTKRLKSSNAQSKNGLLLLQKEIMKILGSKTDPVDELNRSKIRGNYKP